MGENLKSESESFAKRIFNKVPEVTIFFWIIKILCTTVGETAADFLNVHMGFGLTKTSIVMSALLLVFLYFQFKAREYVPKIYWMVVVLISVVGTLITDNLSDNLGVPLEISTFVFTILLIATFLIWYYKERTLSIHSIFTIRREAFYWLAILFTFSLGTAAGDLIAETLKLGYFLSAIMFGSMIAIITLLYYKFNLNSVLAFWLAYILTRPLGATIGDLMSQAKNLGGLGLGTVTTSAIFLTLILMLVIYLAKTGIDKKVVPAEEVTFEEFIATEEAMEREEI
ncbi:protein of unknown function DUF347 [Thermodesulfobium narugense DSM 14796]|uniref:Membrane-anchored protein n=1 Tax=Thermodesulfobium narugense DSM 14796 TaxID=747365 RepID=M1E550_9BACT|nr:membrane protein [Thermodesulfobium narugense]AEE14026.1 protein of unknown function DUF347 [Thermodesulfobium narugense DSM 14796]